MVQTIPAPLKTVSTSQAISKPLSFTSNSSGSSGRSSLCSSRLEFGTIYSEIIRRNLVTDFLEATSLPVNVPIHRSREAAKPPTPMREEFDRCAKQLRFSLASKLFSVPSLSHQEEDEDCGENCNDPIREKIYYNELIFKMEL